MNEYKCLDVYLMGLCLPLFTVSSKVFRVRFKANHYKVTILNQQSVRRDSYIFSFYFVT